MTHAVLPLPCSLRAPLRCRLCCRLRCVRPYLPFSDWWSAMSSTMASALASALASVLASVLAPVLTCVLVSALPLHPAHAQWLPVEPAAVAPLTPAEAALWPDEVAAGTGPPTRSLGLLLRLLQPKHDPADEFALPVAPAGTLRRRVADAVRQAAPATFVREPDGRFVTLAAGGDIDPGVVDALADTISTALLQAGHTLRHAAAERWVAETKGLLRALHDPQALEAARRLSARDAALAEVDAVRVVEITAQPASLYLSVRAASSRPRKLIARVNLDEVLARAAQRAP